MCCILKLKGKCRKVKPVYRYFTSQLTTSFVSIGRFQINLPFLRFRTQFALNGLEVFTRSGSSIDGPSIPVTVKGSLPFVTNPIPVCVLQASTINSLAEFGVLPNSWYTSFKLNRCLKKLLRDTTHGNSYK